MAKASPAKIKKLQGEARRAAEARKAEKAASTLAKLHGDVDLDPYADVDGIWRELGLAAPARRALIDDGHYVLSDLRKVSLAALKELDGMAPNAIRILVAEMKKADIQFRN
jgi:aminoglycoside/choline kinase family phosphotransferase